MQQSVVRATGSTIRVSQTERTREDLPVQDWKVSRCCAGDEVQPKTR